MADLQQFRTPVTKYRKPATQIELADAIGLTANELSHRLGGTGRSVLTQKNILDIVVTLAAWQALSWAQAVELLRLMDHPLDTFEWKTRLHEHLSPLNLSLSLTQKGTPSAIVPEAPEGSQQHPSGRHRLFQAPDLPKGYVPRPKEFNAVKRLLLNRQDGQTTAITTALRGAGGFGKTTLALALCHDPEIQEAFPDGILWVMLGEHPSSPLDMLNGVLASLETPYREAIGLGEVRERWRKALDERVYLLVIDDVWQAEVLLPLLESGPQCRRLVTTRNDVLLPKDVKRVFVDAMELREAVTVLCQGLPEEISQEIYQPQLEALVSRLGRWPLLLTLANGMLTDRVAYHMSIADALTTVGEAYQTYGVTAFRLDNTDERQQNIDACLRASMQYLEQSTNPHYYATERYQELAVFPDDTDIPLATLQTYWKGSAGLESWETTDLCTRLHRLSLLLTCDLGSGTIRLHDVVRSYLIQRAGSHLPALHAHLLDAYQQEHGVTRWANLPQSEAYLWHHLILHLCQASQQEALQTTLTDLSYLTRKVLYVGVSALETDLVLAHTYEQADAVAPAQSLFASLLRTIGRLSHLLRQVHTQAEIGGLLLSYLGWQPPFATQNLVFSRELPRPFLTAKHPLPSRSSSVLLRTLRGHTDRVTSCAVSPDGRFIVSASFDQTLKVWDAATGAERLTLTGHTDEVWDCAVSPDGRFMVSASDDYMLKVWDAASGACLLTFPVDGKLYRCAFHPDGKHLVACGEQGVYFLRLVV